MTENSVKEMFFDTGLIYMCSKFNTEELDKEITAKLIEDNLLCLANESIKFSSTTEVRNIDVAGFNGKKVRGFNRVLRSEGVIEGSALTINPQILKSSMFKSETNSSTKYDVYRAIEGLIADDCYSDAVLVGKSVSGQAIMIVVHNCFNSDGFSIETKDEEEGKCAIKLTSNYDFRTLDKAPFEILTLKPEPVTH